MATLNKKLKIKSGSTTQSCNLYTTTTEAGTNNLKLKVDNQNAYAALGGVGDNNISKARVKKNRTTYAIKTTAVVPYGKKEYRTPGTFTFTVPSSVTKLKVQVAGAGGGGGCGYETGSKSDTKSHYGGQGGNGELINTIISIASSTSIKIIVGKGGAGATWGSEYGSSGGNSSIYTVTARGGGGGSSSGKRGTNYVNGGIGGIGGYGKDKSRPNPGNPGANGWVIVEYGGNIV